MSNQDLVITTDGLSHFKAKQDLENENKFKKKNDSTDLKGAVLYAAAQALTEKEKEQARLNIGAAAPGEGGGGSAEGAVLYTEQALTAEQQSQARANIGTTDGTWESMPDKPFGVNGWVIEWDANPTDTFVPTEGSDGFYKVSDIVPTKDELIGATLKAEMDGTHIDMVLSESDITIYNDSCYGISGNPYFIVTTQETELNFMGTVTLPFPSPGVWFICSSGVTWAYYLGNGELKKIDKKFLPEGIVTTDGNGLIPTSMLPSYVDDVIEGYYNTEDSLFYEEAEFTTELTGETGKIYTDLASRDIYRWSGSVFVQINPKTYRIATNDEIDALFSK